MSLDEEISRNELFELVHYFSKNSYRARDTNAKVEAIQRKCLQLFGKDYTFSTISNNSGDLCGHYPLKLVILESKVSCEAEKGDCSQKANDPKKLRDLFVKARFARCRSRFVVPVILYEGKNICRSATLSGGAEIYGRSGYDFFFAGGESIPDEPQQDLNEVSGTADPLYPSGVNDLFDRIRGQDIRLLKTLKVKYICDLMVEKKKVKFGMRVTSSEKVDKIQRYSDFCLCSVPYPGCEFFRDFKDNEYNADGLHFNWQQDYVDSKFSVPELLVHHLGIEWNHYQSWDLVTLTKNYLLFLIGCIKDGEGGLLIHCISGWDRTPLFISLIRMSLWADGRIHQSLNAAELLYLTIAYDWFLFGHGLPERLQRGEEVFFFCFNFLKNIASDDFSVNAPRRGSTSCVGVKRSDSVGQFDITVLLDERHSRGSNSSLNSISSLTSDQRQSFFIGQEIAEDTELSASSFTSSPGGSRGAYHSSPHSHGSGFDHDGRHQSTSPLPVPHRSRKGSDQRSSSVCGSWQLISGTGSPNGTMSVRDSPVSALGHGSSSTSLVSDYGEDAGSLRQQRLVAIRSLFLQVFFKAVGCATKFEGNSFSSILDQVTEKIREGWGTVV